MAAGLWIERKVGGDRHGLGLWSWVREEDGGNLHSGGGYIARTPQYFPPRAEIARHKFPTISPLTRVHLRRHLVCVHTPYIRRHIGCH